MEVNQVVQVEVLGRRLAIHGIGWLLVRVVGSSGVVEEEDVQQGREESTASEYRLEMCFRLGLEQGPGPGLVDSVLNTAEGQEERKAMDGLRTC